MKRSWLGFSGLHTLSVLSAASRSSHFSRSTNFCLRLPRRNPELSRGYTTPKQTRATVRWPFLFSKALCPLPKLFDLVTLAEFLAAKRSNTVLKNRWQATSYRHTEREPACARIAFRGPFIGRNQFAVRSSAYYLALKDFKKDLLKQFDAHLHSHGRK